MVGDPGGLLDYTERSWRRWVGRSAQGRLEFAVLGRNAVVPPRATVFVFERGSRRPEVVLKIGLNGETSGLSREFESLKAVGESASPSLRTTIPTPLSCEAVGRMHVHAMTPLTGALAVIPRLTGRAPSLGGERTLRRYLSASSHWSANLASATAGSEEFDEQALCEMVGRFSRASDVPSAARECLNSFSRELGRARIRWRPCWQHGDTAPGNVLLRRDGLGVVDWELAEPDAPPWFDTMYTWLALLALSAHRGGVPSLASSAHEVWSRTCWSSRTAARVLGDGWDHPLPLQWALTLTAIGCTLRRRELRRTGGDRWAELVLRMVSDEGLRERAHGWVPHW